MDIDTIVIHYSEIALKGKNRPFFERTLMSNMQTALKEEKYEKLKKYYGRIILFLNEESNLDQITTKLKNVFGISSISPAISTSNKEIEDIKHAAEFLVDDSSYKVQCKRSFKNFPLKSPEVCREVGKHLAETKGTLIDLIAPQKKIFIEITESKTFLYNNKIQGPGGLPVGVSGKVVVLLSGGIDSPVAAYEIMKRGCKPIYLHFHSHPYTSKESMEKAKDLFKELSKFSPNSKLLLMPFIDIQKKIMMGIDKSYRIILYRRYMLRLAQRIAFRNKASAIVTGDNLGQVASQTIQNLRTIGAVSELPIFRPLLTKDKQEIINKAQEINTYKISIQPHEDCCSLFVPKHPATKSTNKTAEGFEERIGDTTEILNESIRNTEKLN